MRSSFVQHGKQCAAVIRRTAHISSRDQNLKCSIHKVLREAQATKLHGSQTCEARRLIEIDVERKCRLPTYPIPILMSRLLSLGDEVVTKVETHTDLARGQEPQNPVGSLLKAASKRAPVEGASRVHSRRRTAGTERQPFSRPPDFEYLCTDLMLAQRPRLATACSVRRSW